MREFAARTEQSGTPELAKDFIAASIDHAAMPIRIERWQLGGEIVHRVVGILWGGSKLTNALAIRFGDAEPWVPIDSCEPVVTNRIWTLWSHEWRPASNGDYRITLRITDATVRTRRLDRGFYARTVTIAG